MERRARLSQQLEQRSGIDPTLVMDLDQATTAMQTSEEQGVSEARTYIESLDAAGLGDLIGAHRSPHRGSTPHRSARLQPVARALPPYRHPNPASEAPPRATSK